ncbi:putative manganese-dependent inorganic diphosphatase [Paraconexibacter sp.]|uniref:putative manganese-dependent inorganic diphosphatase n=1 Tax=Paraconexibacter sp. TaxID=2949640 RepID=UPI003565F77E
MQLSDPRSRHHRPERIYVSGHRNPDTDSIASAIAYAELKSRLDPDTEYVPVRLGELNPQTTWALERSGAEIPRLLVHIMLRAGDVMREEFPVADAETPLRVAGQMMVDAGLDLLPVVDGDGVLTGVLAERALARRYVRESGEASHLLAPTSVGTLADTLSGELLAGDRDAKVDGRVWVLARQLDAILGDVSPGDVAVVGDRHDAQLRALELGISTLVISNGTTVPDATLELARKTGTPVIVTPLDSYVAGRMTTLSSPCQAIADREPLTARARDLVADISEDVKDVSYRAAVVVDRAGRPIGLVTRADLVAPRPRRVILVDHAESAQSVEGIDEAEIVEILDHHHIGSIETTHPVRATFDPVGSTSTLIAEQFLATGQEPSPQAAGMLLAAILSDTVILSSPTTTPRDEAAVTDLGEQLGIDPRDYGREMFEATSDVSGLKASEILARDLKAYELSSGQTICIGQIETVGDAIMSRVDELREAAEDRVAKDGHRLVALMVTDVATGGTNLVVAGDLALAARAFNTDISGGYIELPGVMSRKKQVAPPLMKAA